MSPKEKYQPVVQLDHVKKVILGLLCFFSGMIDTAAQNDRLMDFNIPYGKMQHVDSIRKWIGIAAGIENKFNDSAMAIYAVTIAGSRQIGYDSGIVSSLRGIANVYASRQLFKEAAANYEEAIRLAKSRPHVGAYLPLIYNNLGVMKDNMGYYDQAVFSYTQSLKYKDTYPKTTLSKSSIYLNLSATFFHLRQNKKGINYLDSAELIARRNHDIDALCSILNNKGAVAGMQKKFDLSENYFRQSMDLAKSNGLYHYVALLNIGLIKFSKDSLDDAISIFNSIIHDSANVKPIDYGKTLNALADIYYDKKSYLKSETLLKQSVIISLRNNDVNTLQESYQLLYRVKKNMGNYKESLGYFEKYDQIRDSTLKTAITENANRLEMVFRTAEKDKSLVQQQLIISRQKSNIRFNILILFACASLIFLLMLLLFFYRKSFKARQQTLRSIIKNQEQEKVLQEKDNELKLLKAGIEGEEKERARLARELHDGIGGMLAAVKMNMSLEGKKNPQQHQKVMDMIAATADEVRKTAQNLMPDVLIRNGLEKSLEAYCQSVNMDRQMEVTLDLQGLPFHLDTGSELMIYRIVQELIQNTMKHAAATELSVLIKHFNNKLSIIVEDNGSGFNTTVESKGLGLQNLMFRVSALEGRSDIFSTPGKGTIIHIEFEVNKLRNNI